MTEVKTTGLEGEDTSEDEYRSLWLNIVIDELLLECYEGIL